MSMQKITKLVAREIGASRAAVGKDGFKTVAVFLVPEDVDPGNMWGRTTVSRSEFYDKVRDWALCYTEEHFKILCNRYSLGINSLLDLSVSNEDLAGSIDELASQIRKFPNQKVVEMVRERAIACIFRPEVSFPPTFLFKSHRVEIEWSDIPGNLTVSAHIFGWDIHANFGRGERYEFKNVPWGEVEAKIENYFRFLKQIKGDEPQDLTKTETANDTTGI